MQRTLSLLFAFLLSTIISCEGTSSLPESIRLGEKMPRGRLGSRCSTGEDTADVFLEASSLPNESSTFNNLKSSTLLAHTVIQLLQCRGGGWIPAGYHPFGYQITELGERFLSFEGSLDSDLGRFLASVRERKSKKTMQSQWLEIVRAAKQGQSMRIYRSLDDLIDFCLKAGFLS